MRRAVWTFLILVTASISEARTWRVNAAGTGDAPDLYAAMDSAAAFDSVLAEAGQYNVPTGLLVPRNVWLVGESGPSQTLVFRDEYLAPSVVSLAGFMSGIHLRGNTATVLYSQGGVVDHCIIESTLSPGTLLLGDNFYSISFQSCLFAAGEIAFPATFNQCIILANLGEWAVGSTVTFCDVIGTAHPSIDVSSNNLNFSLDPEFCGIPGSGNYFLRSTSPCLPENNPFGPSVLTGPLPMGCGTVRVEHRTWGGIKALYR